MEPYESIRGALARGETVLIDGATGTELERRGAEMHPRAWCATATLTHPEVLRAVHEDYIRAGVRVITTNTFSTNRNMLAPAGLGDRFEELNRRAVAIALEARERTGAADRVAVAGSMSHQVPILQGSDQRELRHAPPLDVASDNFREMAELLAASGVDFLLMEMMSDPDLARPAIAAARATGLPVWVGYSVRSDGDDRLRAYTRPELDAAAMLDAIALDGIDAAGFMHCKVHEISAALELLRGRFDGPLIAYPDSGWFKMPHWHFEEVIPPDEFVGATRGWIAGGVRIVGACCGLGIEHIRALADAIGE